MLEPLAAIVVGGRQARRGICQKVSNELSNIPAELSPEALYLRLRQLVAEMPDALKTSGEVRHRWLGRASALLYAAGHIAEVVTLRTAGEALDHLAENAGAAKQRNKIALAMHRALAAAEITAPVEMQGAFIQVGDKFEAFAAIGKALQTANKDVLLVDPYADKTILTDFAVQVAENMTVRILTDERNHKPTLKPALENWVKQYGDRRPLEVRAARHKSIHDRLIIVDCKLAWDVGQSFKDLVANAPTGITRVDADTAQMKIAAYGDLWNEAQML